MNFRASLQASIFCAFIAAASVAHATIIVHTSQSTFLAAVTNAGTDTFDDLPLTSVPSPTSRTAGPHSYAATASFGDLFGVESPFTGNHWLSTDNAVASITFDGFGPGVNAIGGFFFITDAVGFTPGSVTLTAVDADGSVTEIVETLSFLDITLLKFVGFVSDKPLTSLTVAEFAFGLSFATVNDLVLAGVDVSGTAVPAPASLALLGLGLAGLGWSRRRK